MLLVGTRRTMIRAVKRVSEGDVRLISAPLAFAHTRERRYMSNRASCLERRAFLLLCLTGACVSRGPHTESTPAEQQVMTANIAPMVADRSRLTGTIRLTSTDGQ